MSLKGFFGHLRTINRHRHKVIAHCAKAGILWQGLRHDLSKYSPTEFIPGVKYFQGTRSPNEAERELNGYSLAWMHHKGRNRHHFEYWIDVDPVEKIYKPVRDAAAVPCGDVLRQSCGKQDIPRRKIPGFRPAGLLPVQKAYTFDTPGDLRHA